MYDEFTDWLKAILGIGYQYRHGQWEETESLFNQSICLIQAAGGAPIDVEDRRPRFQVYLLGPRNSRGAAQALKDDIYAVANATIDHEPPCGSASIRAMTEPTGPGYTTENRAYWLLTLQTTY